MPWSKRIAHRHLQGLVSLLWDHLAVHERVLDARVMLDQPVLTKLEVVVLELVESEGVVMTPVEVANLGPLLSNLSCRSGARIGIGCLQAEFWGMHVVLLPTLDGCRRKGSCPPEEHAQNDVACVVDVEDMLARHKVLDPEVLPKRGSPIVWNLKGSMKTPAVEGNELVGLDVALQRLDGRPSQPRQQECHGSAPLVLQLRSKVLKK
mmetsp:Transcript_58698/g.94989  ORF Transcript_58698/g.94989 Transcript_58698/m.94989 type:complete len:207 (-) Transcript_58698:24-644(-)